MRWPYLLLSAVALLAACQPQETVSKGHGIKEVYLVQFRYYYSDEFNQDTEVIDYEALPLIPKPKVLGYTSLRPKSGEMEVWDGFFNDSISYYKYGTAPKEALSAALSYFSGTEANQYYYYSENSAEVPPLYCGPELFFEVIRENGTGFIVGFAPYMLPEELKKLYEAMDYSSRRLRGGNRVLDASATGYATFLLTIDSVLTGRVSYPPSPDLPPPPPPVKYHPNPE